MHFKNDNKMNSYSNQTTIPTTAAAAVAGVTTIIPTTGTAISTTTTNATTIPTPTSTTSCTSSTSTDSGVVLIDHEIKLNNYNYNYNNQLNNNKYNNYISRNDTTTPTITDSDNEFQEKNNKAKLTNDVNYYNEKNIDDKLFLEKTKNNFNLENVINATIAKNSKPSCDTIEIVTIEDADDDDDDDADAKESAPQYHNHTHLQHHLHSHSPSASLRSNSISVVSIDENAIDSSVVDSDESDECGDNGLHKTYIVKKLGQQTTYAPDSDDIPNINKGLTVLSQKITPNGGGILSTTDAAAGVGTLAENMLNGSLSPAQTNSPQIGSIALTNSTDVTFGDKHFYEGPVTIQQFLIDSRDKFKKLDEDGHENPAYAEDEKQTKNGASSKENFPPNAAFNKVFYKRKVLLITGVIFVILLAAVIVTTTTLLKSTRKSKQLGDGEDYRKNIPINSTIDADNIGGGKILRIVPRDGWLAQPPSKPPTPLNLPISRVIVIATQTDICTTQAACTYRVRFIQTFNIESLRNDDIIYNFLIGGDGNVYEGRGWHNRGAHLKGFNDDSVSFAYIGSFKTSKPSAKQLNVTRLLLEDGVRFGKLSSDYKIYSAHKLDPSSTETSANGLYESFKGWPHWVED